MLYQILNSFLKQTDPEVAHEYAIKFLKQNIIPFDFFRFTADKSLKIKVFGIDFDNPIGLAAGFDKNAEVYNSIFKLGFGFSEVGTITPEPQDGNPKPRVFRLNNDQAIINSLGFPNDGMNKVYETIKNNPKTSILGINIGPNKENATNEDDYLKCMEKLYPLADYITINISSPNTPNLRNLHDKKKISDLINTLQRFKNNLKENKAIIFKLSPNLNDSEIYDLSEIFIEKKIDGIVLTNTTIKGRELLKDVNKSKEGGLSGYPLNSISNQIIKNFYKNLKGNVPIIGAGGVSDGSSAYKKIKCGASLLQLYTAMVFKGPYIASKINKELSNLLKKDGLKNISEAIGVDTN